MMDWLHGFLKGGVDTEAPPADRYRWQIDVRLSPNPSTFDGPMKALFVVTREKWHHGAMADWSACQTLAAFETEDEAKAFVQAHMHLPLSFTVEHTEQKA